MTSDMATPFRTPAGLAATLGVAVLGGLVAAVLAVFAWPVVAYVGQWVGAGPVDPTWNDGDAAIAFTAAGVVAVLLGAVALGAWTIARRVDARGALWAAGALVVAAGVAAIPLLVLLAPH